MTLHRSTYTPPEYRPRLSTPQHLLNPIQAAIVSATLSVALFWVPILSSLIWAVMK